MRLKRLLLAALPALVAGVSAVAASCSLPDELDQTNIVNQFFPNFWAFFAHVVAFTILLCAVTALVWRPARRAITRRADLIAKGAADAERDRQAAAAYLKEANERRAEAAVQAQRLKDAAADEAYRLKKDKEAEAKRGAAAIIADARKESQRLEASLRQKMRDEIVDVALEAAAALAKRELEKEPAERFVDDFIAQLGETSLD